MSWYKLAKSQSFTDRVKDKIRTSPFFQKLFSKYSIPPEQINDLEITLDDLDGSFAKANGDELVIDKSLANDKEFFDSKFHFIAHEMVHWLKRRVEKENYFADPEEVEGFSTAIAYAIYMKKSDNLSEMFLPMLKTIMQDDEKAKQFLNERIKDARKMLNELKLCSFS